MTVIEKTKELGKMIQQGENYKRMMLAKEKNDEDQELQKLIGDFNMLRAEIMNKPKDTPQNDDQKQADNQKMMDLYNQIMNNPNMAEYNKAKAEVDVMMDTISKILLHSVNGFDPETADQIQSGCGGSCSSCSGCN